MVLLSAKNNNFFLTDMAKKILTILRPEYVFIFTYGSPGVWGIWGEGLSIFWELGSIGYYVKGAGEQANSFGDLGKVKK